MNSESPALADRTLDCLDCHCAAGNTELIWTAREQQFWAEKGFGNPPKRCPGFAPDLRPPGRHRPMGQSDVFGTVQSTTSCDARTRFAWPNDEQKPTHTRAAVGERRGGCFNLVGQSPQLRALGRGPSVRMALLVSDPP